MSSCWPPGRHAARQVSWRQGTNATNANPTAKIRSNLVAIRVRPANRNIPRGQDGSLPEVWLIAEWPQDQPEPVTNWLSNMPARTRPKSMMQLGKLRWRIEHDYRELKTGLGLDHFEGRSLIGWHRHVTLTVLAQACCTLLSRRTGGAAGPSVSADDGGRLRRCSRDNNYLLVEYSSWPEALEGSPAMILTLVRHGEPARDASGAGAADPPLSPVGRRQIEVTRCLVEADGYDAVWCSPLRRARESAEILAPGVDLVVDEDLAEFDRNTEQYLHWEDRAEVYQKKYMRGDLSPWGTTLAEFRGRIAAVVERMRTAAPGPRLLAVTHGGVVNNLFSLLLGSPRVSLIQPAYGSVNRFLHHPAEGWTPMELNASAAR